MAVLTWDNIGEKLFETGISKGVLYPMNSEATGDTPYTPGYAWNGLTSVAESPSGADSNKQYADNIVYANLRGAEEFGGTIEAFTFPEQWYECDGSVAPVAGVMVGQQTRRSFGLCYRSEIGNDSNGVDYGYKLHLVYNATASPSEKTYETINDSPEAATLSWEFDTIPIDVTINGDKKKTALLTIDSTKVSREALDDLEAALYGTENEDPYLPLPDDVIAMFESSSSGNGGSSSGNGGGTS